MASYVVIEDPGQPGRAEGVALIRDGFSWLAFLFGPLWLLWHRLWAEALLAVVAFCLLGALPIHGLAGSLLSLAVPLYLGLEGQGMRVTALVRRGWLEWGVVEAADADDADLRYAAEIGDLARQPREMPSLAPAPAPVRPAQAGIALGLNHVPGRP
jgi:hypothetical protein